MTDKQIVKDFLHFLNNHKGHIITDKGVEQTYSCIELRKAIINCLNQAMEDGYKKGHTEAEANALYDVTIGGHKDW